MIKIIRYFKLDNIIIFKYIPCNTTDSLLLSLFTVSNAEPRQLETYCNHLLVSKSE